MYFSQTPPPSHMDKHDQFRNPPSPLVATWFKNDPLFELEKTISPLNFLN